MTIAILRRPQLIDRDSPLRVAAPFHVAGEARRAADILQLLTMGLKPISGGDLVSAETCPRVDIAAGTQISGTTEGVISTSPSYAGSGASTGGTGGFWRTEKVVEVVLRGVATTGGTPGTLILNWRLDSTSGASLGASATLTLLASQTNVAWTFRGDLVCQAIGSSGKLWGQGELLCNAALIAENVNMVPASAPAQATIDTTANHTLVVTALLSQAGSSLTTQQALWRTRN
jgi:hypothetical protein